MFVLSKFEWLALAVALFLCPGSLFGAEPEAASGRTEFNLVVNQE